MGLNNHVIALQSCKKKPSCTLDKGVQLFFRIYENAVIEECYAFEVLKFRGWDSQPYSKYLTKHLIFE